MASDRKRDRDSELDESNPKRKKIQGPSNATHVSQPADSAFLFLKGMRIFILKAGIEKTRMQIFKSQLTKFGGCVEENNMHNCTNLIVDDKMDLERFCRISKIDLPPQNIPIIKCSWLSACFKNKSLVCSKTYELDVKHYIESKVDLEDDLPVLNDKATDTNKTDTEAAKNTGNGSGNGNVEKKDGPKVGIMWRAFNKSEKKECIESDGSDYNPSDEEAEHFVEETDMPGPSDTTLPPRRHLPKGNWVCAQSSTNPRPNLNQNITDKLEEMVKKYKSTNDTWRAFGYQKGIQALKKHPKAITSWEEAKGLPGVGAKLADKIWEIAESGELRKLNEYRSSEDVKILEMFTNIWGAGPHTARTWYQMGFRTLDDVKNKANLTHQQEVGLRLYDDILDRMSREEAGKIEQVVREAAEAIQPGIVAQACGSYRRGKKTCGDVDVLVTHPDGKSHKGIFHKLLSRLKEQGFLTDDLVTAEENKNQKKYLGVCKLPGVNTKHRRLDIIVVPYGEYACALMYFTGSAHFNRSLRHLCGKMGMSLSEHSLNTGVVRSGKEKIFEGTPLPTPTEESVFEHLGIPYRAPHERDH
ncbi:hypothetical protein ScPMuIL_000307 [Solemya velum]